MNPLLILNFIAAVGALGAFRIAAAGTDDQTVVQASAGTDPLLGVTTDVGAALGERVDVVLAGTAHVEFGDDIDYGEPLTSDANGKAVPAVPGDRVVGTAMCGGADGDIGLMLITPGSTQPEPPTP